MLVEQIFFTFRFVIIIYNDYFVFSAWLWRLLADSQSGNWRRCSVHRFVLYASYDVKAGFLSGCAYGKVDFR